MSVTKPTSLKREMSLRHDLIGLGEIIESGTGALTAGDDVVDEYAFQHIRGYRGC